MANKTTQNQGANTISVIGDVPDVPNVEHVKIPANIANAVISNTIKYNTIMKGLTNLIRTALLLLVSFMAANASAQLSGWKNITSTNWIKRMAINGNSLWLATEGGLVMYNTNTGESKFYNRANTPVPENNILSVSCDDRSVWFGTSKSGVAKLENNTITTFNKQNSGMCSNQYNMQIALDGKGNTWFGGLLAFYKYDGNKWETFSIPELVISSMATFNAFAFDHDGKLWFGGMNCIKDNVFGYYTEKTGVVSIGGINYVTGMAIDDNGNKWLSTEKSGIAMYDGKKFTRFTTNDYDVPTNNTRSLIIDKNNKLWFGADKYLVGYDGKTFTKFALPSEKLYDRVYSILADGDKIWVGSERSGLYKYENGELAHVDIYKSVLPTNNVDSAITVANNGEAWIGTSSGLVHIDKDNNSSTILASNDTVNKIKDIAIDKKNNVWVALNFTDTCILKISDKDTVAFLTSNCPIERNSITDIATDENNVLWVGTEKGLFSYDGSNWENFNEEGMPVKGEYISHIAVDSQNNLWLNVYDKGLIKFDGKTWSEYTQDNSPLPANFIRSIAIDKEDRIWIASGSKHLNSEPTGGLTCFDGKNWKTYTKENSGLPSNTITSIAIDANGNIWLGTYGNVGVTMFNGNDRWEIFNTFNSGIADNDIAGISIDQLRNTIWMNGFRSRGISVAQIDGNTTGINAAKTKACNSAIYDLSGLKVAHPEKGNVYISNGRKFIKK